MPILPSTVASIVLSIVSTSMRNVNTAGGIYGVSRGTFFQGIE